MNRRFVGHYKTVEKQSTKVRLFYIVAATFLVLILLPFIARISAYLLIHKDSYTSVKCAVLLTSEGVSNDAVKLLVEDMHTLSVDRILVSGKQRLSSNFESDDVITYLIEEGYPPHKIYVGQHTASSLEEEASALISFLQVKGVDTAVVYTSGESGDRVNDVFNSLSKSTPKFLIANSKEGFNPKTWLRNAASRRKWAVEWGRSIVFRVESFFGVEHPLKPLHVISAEIPGNQGLGQKATVEHSVDTVETHLDSIDSSSNPTDSTRTMQVQ